MCGQLALSPLSQGTTGNLHLFDVSISNVNARTIELNFSTTGIPDSTLRANSPRQWFLHIRVALSTYPLHQETVLPFTLSSPPPAPLPSPAPALEGDAVPLAVYAGLGSMVSISCVLVLCTVLAVAVACKAQGKHSFHSKAMVMRETSLKDLGHRLNSSKERAHHNTYTGVPTLKRTCSTTGFPTQEHRLKKGPRGPLPSRAKNSHAPALRTPPPAALKRSHSLPSLHNPSTVLGKEDSLPPFFTQDPAVVVRRINPSRTHTRIKKVNVESSKLHSWTSQQLKRNREFSNLHMVQDLAIKHKNYGVNEIQHGPLQSQGMLYARYVVRSLAASANTPEPGSRPITNL